MTATATMMMKIATPAPIRRQPLVRFCMQAALSAYADLLPTAYCLLSEASQIVVTLLQARQRIRALVLLDEMVLDFGCRCGLQDGREVQGTAADLDERLRRHAFAERLRCPLH